MKMSTSNIPGDKGGRCVRLTTSLPSCAEFHEIWEPKPSGTLWATPGLLRDYFTSFTLIITTTIIIIIIHNPAQNYNPINPQQTTINLQAVYFPVLCPVNCPSVE
jgi:hypothetical protein